MSKFKVGKDYQTRSPCDWDCIIMMTVLSRTDKTITADLKHRGVQKFRVGTYDGVEFVRPWGRYSMSPIIRAS